MSLPKKSLLAATIIGSVSLSGCSTIGNLFGSDDSYRSQQGAMVADLEMPPNLFNPARAQNASTLAMLDAERRALAAKNNANSGTIPTFQAEGLAIKSNLSERWLEVDSKDAQNVWNQLQRFFNSQGFRIEEARKDIGIMKTAFLSREQIVPTDDQGPITKLLNSWRDQYADGVYDKFTARLEGVPDQSKVKIYFAHHMMYSGEANQVIGGADAWTLKPSNPVMEAEALYQAMVFFGSTPEQAMTQLAATENRVEILDGEEFTGLKVNAGYQETWNYLQTSVYRAGWDLGKVNQSQGVLEVKVPESARNETSFISSLAFWRSKSKTEIPETILIVVSSESAEVTNLSAKAPEGESMLTAEQRRYIFESIGLLTK